jgi:hypothetical protein
VNAIEAPTAAQPVTIIEAMDDPELFGPLFTDASWLAWRAFLTALFGLPLSDDQVAIYRACTGRSDAPAAAFIEAALIVGRRGGKSRVLALIAVVLATLRDYTPFLAPGEVGTVAVLAANRSQARAIFRYVSGLLRAVPLLRPLIQDETTDAIMLTNRVAIEISTASFRTARGYTFIAVLADEIAFWRSDESSANPDVEILRALRPGLASIPGAMLLLASSPYAKRGELYAAFRRHYGKDGARVLVWKAATETMNRKIDPAIIAEAYESDPEAARAEYGAEFRDDLADFITREVVDAITCWGRSELPPETGIAYAGFCDPSGGASDAMTLAIAHLQGDVAVLDATLEIRPPFNPDDAVAECAALLRRFGIARIEGDRYAGLWPVARFAAHGITFEQSARPKNELYHDFLPLANAKRVELLENTRLAAQLIGLERRTARSGRDSIDHSPGGHDDLANAVCGVLVGLDLDRRAPLVRSGDMLADGQGVPLPRVCDVLVAVLAADQSGQCAVAYWAYSPHTGYRLTLADFETGPLSSVLFNDIATRVKELAAECRARRGIMLFSTSEPLARQASARGLVAEIVPAALIADPARLAMAAAGHVMDGRVKIGIPALERAKSSPLRGQLDVRGGDPTDGSPLRLALLAGIAVCLDDQSQSQATAA